MTKLKRQYVSEEGGSESNAKRLKRRGKGKALQQDKDPFFIGDLKKGKGKVVQVDCEEMRELQKREEEDAFFRKLLNKRVTSTEVEKLRDAGIRNLNDLIEFTREKSNMNGLKKLRLQKILKVALEAGKVRGVNHLLKQTAYWKERSVVIVKNLPKGVTATMLMNHFKICKAEDAEIRKSKQYGLVVFKQESDAKMAVVRMDGTMMFTERISVQLGVY